MLIHDIPAAIEYLQHWTRAFQANPEAFRIDNRKKIVATIATELLEMSPEESCEFQQRALARAAFANPDTFAMRVVQSLSEVAR